VGRSAQRPHRTLLHSQCLFKPQLSYNISWTVFEFVGSVMFVCLADSIIIWNLNFFRNNNLKYFLSHRKHAVFVSNSSRLKVLRDRSLLRELLRVADIYIRRGWSAGCWMRNFVVRVVTTLLRRVNWLDVIECLLEIISWQKSSSPFVEAGGTVRVHSGVNVSFRHLHSCTVHLDTIKVFYLPTDAQ